MDYQLSPDLTADIPDIKSGDELFSDGCGLAARKLLISLSKAKRIVFRGDRYTPSVIQIRSDLTLAFHTFLLTKVSSPQISWL